MPSRREGRSESRTDARIWWTPPLSSINSRNSAETWRSRRNRGRKRSHDDDVDDINADDNDVDDRNDDDDDDDDIDDDDVVDNNDDDNNCHDCD